MSISPESREKIGPVLNFLLGVGAVEAPNEIVQPEEIHQHVANRMSGQAKTYSSNVSGYPQGVPEYIMSGQGRPGYAQGIPQQQKQVNYKGRNAALRRSQQSRRSFLWGPAAG